MVDKNFIGLDKPDITRFESYLPTAFSSELTLLQKVNKIIQDLNRSFDLTNEMVDYLNRFIESFDEKLYETIEDVLTVWLEDGRLADVVRVAISEEVIEARTDYLGHTYLNLKERLDSENTEVTTQLTQKATQVDTLGILKNSHFNIGEVVETTGFSDVFDRGGGRYIITDTPTNAVDGITVIELTENKYAELNMYGGLPPQLFGIRGDENEVESIEKWRIYLKYVHDSVDRYFNLLSPIASEYNIYEPLIFERSLIGEKSETNPTFTYKTSKVPLKVADVALMTDTFNFSYNVKAVISFKTPNLGNRYDIKNFKVNCGDDDTIAMDYGVYIPETIRVNVEGIRVNRPNRIGIYVLSTWVSSMSNCEVFKTNGKGIVIGKSDPNGGQTKTGTSTSFDINSLYVNGAVEGAYDIYGLQYSELSGLAADHIKGNYTTEVGATFIYQFELCKGLTLNSLAMEGVKVRNVLIFHGCGGITINSPYFLNVEYSTSIIGIGNYVERYNGAFIINSPSFMDGIRGLNGVNPSRSYYFDTKSLVIFNGDSTGVTLDNGVIVNVVFGSNQMDYIENVKKTSRRLVDGVWKYFSVNSRSQYLDISRTDVSSEFTLPVNARNLKAYRYGEHAFVTFIIDVVSGYNSGVTTTLNPIANTVLSVHKVSGDEISRNTVASAAIDPKGNIIVLSNDTTTLIVSGYFSI